MKTLKQKYENIVSEYINHFSNQHKIDFDGWVGDKVGEVALFGDYFFNFDDLRYAVDNEISFDLLIDWYYFVLEYRKTYYNLDSYFRLRRDTEKLHGENFDVNLFHAYLIYLRIPKKSPEN
jgi:hypothetical protein